MAEEASAETTGQLPSATPAGPPPSASGEEEPRSGYGSVPGAEFPASVYLTILFAYVWMLLSAWMAFGGDGEEDLILTFATILVVIIVALPALLTRMAAAQSPGRRALPDTVSTATGTLPMSEACVQVLLLPIILAFAATAFGLTYVLS